MPQPCLSGLGEICDRKKEGCLKYLGILETDVANYQFMDSHDIQNAIALLMTNQAMSTAEFAFARDYLLSCADLVKNVDERDILRNLIDRARIYPELRSAIAILNQHQIYPVEALYSDQAIGKQQEVTAITR
jgi:hypothetical protein